MNRFSKAACQIVAILGVTAIAVAAKYHLNPDSRLALYLVAEPLGANEVLLTEVLAWEEPPVWIDARADSEYAKGHIPGAISLNEQNFDSQMVANAEKLLDHTTQFIVYCDRQACQASKKVAERLEEIGLMKVKVLRNGWRAWQEHHAGK